MEKQNKTLLTVIIALIVVAAVAIYITQSAPKNDTTLLPVEDDKTDVYQAADRVAFEQFLRANLSELSPEKEVLGGTFYLTSIEWETDRNAVIAYEDGHIALNARVGFSMVGANNDNVQVDYFNIITEDQTLDESLLFEASDEMAVEEGDFSTQVIMEDDLSAQVMIVE